MCFVRAYLLALACLHAYLSACMTTCVCVCACVCMPVCMCACLCSHLRAFVPASLRACGILPSALPVMPSRCRRLLEIRNVRLFWHQREHLLWKIVAESLSHVPPRNGFVLRARARCFELSGSENCSRPQFLGALGLTPPMAANGGQLKSRRSAKHDRGPTARGAWLLGCLRGEMPPARLP